MIMKYLQNSLIMTLPLHDFSLFSFCLNVMCNLLPIFKKCLLLLYTHTQTQIEIVLISLQTKKNYDLFLKV